MNKSAFHRPRLLNVYLEQSSSVAELNKALVKASMEFTPIVRDTLCVKMAQGRKVEYRVASLHSLRSATMPALLKHGVLPHQDYCVSNEGVTLVTTLSYGDEFRCSTLPIRQFEDDDRQKAHMTKMRKAGYEAVLFLASEDEGQEEEPAAAQPEQSQNGKPHANRMWQRQEELAAKAIDDCSTAAQVEDVIAKVRGKIDAMDMDPHSLGRIEGAAKKRIDALVPLKQKEAAK